MNNLLQNFKTNKQKITYLFLAGMLMVSVVVMTSVANVADADDPSITISISDDDGDTQDSDDETTKTREKTVTASVSTSHHATLTWRYKLLPLVNGDVQECDATTMASGTRSGRVARITSENYNDHVVCFRASHPANANDGSSTVAGAGYSKTNTITGIDRTRPAKPTDIELDSDNDTGVSDTDGITSTIENLTITGCAETGSSVALYNGSAAINGATDTADDSDVACTTTGTNGFSIDIDLAERSKAYIISAEATDVAGNTSYKSDKKESASIIVDTTAPKVKLTHRLKGGVAGEGDDNGITYLNTGDTITVTMTFTEANGMSEASTARPTVTFYNDTTSIGTDTPTNTDNTRVATYTITGSDTVTSGDLKYDITNETSITDKAGNSLAEQSVKTIANTVIDTGDPTVGSIAFTTTNDDSTQAAESDEIVATMLFSEKISQKTSNTGIYYRLGNSGNGTRFSFATGRSFTSGQCQEKTSTANQYECKYTVKTGDTGEFQVSIDKFADYAGNTGVKADFTGSITVDTGIVAPSSITLKRGVKDRDNDTAPSFVVTVGETGGVVTLYEDSQCGTTISSEETVTDTSKPYIVEVTVDGYESDGSDDGAKTIYATHEDDAGNISSCSTTYGSYTLDTSSPTVDEVATGYYKDASVTQLISLTDGRGKVAAGSSIYTKVVFDEEVRYRPGLHANALPEIKYTIGETESRYRIVSYASTLSGGRCKPTNADNISDTYICQYKVSSNDTGSFALMVDTNTEDLLEHTLEDTYTHADTLTLDSTAPAKPSALDLSADDDSGNATDDDITNKTSNLTIEGCAETDSTVQLYANGIAIENATDTADDSSYDCSSDDDDGFSIDISLTEGVQRITAKATDDSNNTSAASTALAITVDTTAPTAGVDGEPTGVNNTDTLDVTVDGTDVTHYQYAVISGTSCSSASYTSGDTDGTAIADKITDSVPSTDGSVVLCVVGRDKAGNWQTKANVTTATWTRDQSAPATPPKPDLAAEDDSGLYSDDDITKNTQNLTITGCAEADSSVTLYANGGAVNGSVTANGTGCTNGLKKYTKDITLATSGTHNITVKATDASNNESAVSEALVIEIKGTAPAITAGVLDLAAADDSGIDNDNITKNTTALTISGTLSGVAGVGDYVQLYDGTTLVAGATDSTFDGTGSRNWSADVALTGEGARTVTARVHDVAGNEGSATSMTITIDTTGPTVSVTKHITSPTTDLTPDIKIRTSDPGTVSFGGACTDTSTTPTVQTVVAGENTVTLPTLANDTFSDCTAIVTDVTGNPSTGAKINTFIVDNTPPTLASAIINNVGRTETQVSLNEPVYAPTAPSKNDFQVAIGGVVYADYIKDVSGFGKTQATASQSFIVTTNSPLPTSGVSIRYTKGTNHIFDRIGNTLEDFSTGVPVTDAQFVSLALDVSDDTGSDNADGVTRFEGDEVTVIISISTGTFANSDQVRVYKGASTSIAHYTVSNAIRGANYIDADGQTSMAISVPKSKFSAGANALSGTYAKAGGIEGNRGATLSVTYDTTAPTITVRNPDGTSSTQKEVSATDNESGTTVWQYKILTESVQVCNAATMTTGTTAYTEGDALTLNQTTHNNSRVCFSSEDAAGNSTYRASNTIGGIDGTAPTVVSAGNTSPDGRTVRVTMSEPVYAATTPALNDFKVVIGTTEYPVRSISGFGTSASTAKDMFTITLPATAPGTRMTLKYTQGTHKITDAVGNALASFASQTIDNMKLISLTLDAADDTGSNNSDNLTTFDGTTVGFTATLSEGSFENGDTVRVYVGTASNPAQVITVSDLLSGPLYRNAAGNVRLTFELPKSAFTEGENTVVATYTSNGDSEGEKGNALTITYDATAPTITVSNPDTDAALQKTVSATDTDTTETTWTYKHLPGTTVCEAAVMNGGTAAYTEDAKNITFTSENDNGTKVCFSSTDAAGNTAYTASELLSGIDTTAPTVTAVSIVSTTRDSTEITFSEPVYAATAITANDFRILSGQNQYRVISVSDLPTSKADAKTAITLRHVAVGETANVELQYTKQGSGITDTAGNGLESFTKQIKNTAFVTLAIDGQDDTGSSANDGITRFDGDDASFTVSLTSGTFASGDQIKIYRKGASAALTTVIVSTTGSNTVNANGRTSFTITLPSNVFNEGLVTLYATYMPIGQIVQTEGIDYSFTYDKTAPVVTVTEPNTTPTAKKQISASDIDSEATAWVYKAIDANELCSATALATESTPYTEGSSIDLAANNLNGKKVCFSSVDVAGNTTYAASGTLEGIDSAAPTVTSAVIENYSRTRTVVTFSEKVYASDGFSPSEFTIEIGNNLGYNQYVSSIENLATTAKTARKTIVLTHPTISDQIPSSIVYTPGSEMIRDIAGNTLQGFTKVIDNTSFITLDLAEEDDTGIDSNDNYTQLEGSTVTLTVTLTNNAQFSNSDVVTIYRGEDRNVVRRIVVSAFPASDSVNAHGAGSFKIDIPKSSFAGNAATVLSAGYAPFGNAALNKIGGVLQVTVDTTAPDIEITEASTGPSAKKTVSATSDDATEVTWKYVQIQSGVVCDADAIQSEEDYTKGKAIPFTKESDNGTKVCFSATDLAGNIAYKSSEVINGIDTELPIVASVAVTGIDELTVTTSEPVYSVAGPNADDFVVFINDTPVANDSITGIPTTVASADNQFTLVVSDTFSANDTIALSYIGSSRSNSDELIKDTIGNTMQVFDEIAATLPSTLTLTLDPAYDTGADTTDGLTRFGDGSDVGIVVTVNEGVFKNGDRVRIYRSNDSNALATIVVGIRGGEVNARGETSLVAMIPKTQFTEGAISLHATYTARGANEGLPGASLSIVYDLTAPSITVTSPTDDLAQSKAVSARDGDATETVWTYKQTTGNARCDAAQMNSGTQVYTEGADILFSEESDNGTKVCFSATDAAGNTTYERSKVLKGIDTAAPVINITSPTSGSAKSKVVSAVDGDSVATVWAYKQITGNASCNEAQMSGGTDVYDEGADITFNRESDNNTRVCFSSTDGIGNVSYAASAKVDGIDTTAPSISVDDPNTRKERSKTVSATDNDSEGTTWAYKHIDGNMACNAGQMSRGTRSYDEGAGVLFSEEYDNGLKVCFSSTDRVGNVSYAASSVLAGLDTTAPVISVNNPSDEADQVKAVSAIDDDYNEDGKWAYKQIDGGEFCGSGQMAGGTRPYFEGEEIPFSTESDNGTKVCFSVTDSIGNVSYADSFVLQGIDTTAPNIEVENPDMSVVSRTKEVRAADDEDASRMVYRQIPDTASCGSQILANASGYYTEGTYLSFNKESDNGTKVCFASVDAVGNFSFVASSVLENISEEALDISITVDLWTDPNQPLDPTVQRVQAKAVIGTDRSDLPTTWVYKQIAGDASCDISLKLTEGVTRYTEGASIILREESDNNTKICFITTDQSSGTVSAAASEVIVGIDNSAPAITITNPDTDLAQTKIVSAVDSDIDDATVWAYRQIAGNASCDVSQMAGEVTTYAEGSEITFTKESDNGTKVCFASTDTVNNTSYGVSEVLAGIDATAPTITVTNPDVTTPSAQKMVHAADTEENSVLHYQQVAGDIVCAAESMTDARVYTEDEMLTFSRESDNGTRVCFSSTDTVGNTAYTSSVVLANIDRTATTVSITITTGSDSDSIQKDGEPLVYSQKRVVSATDSDYGVATVWFYKQIAGSASCGENQMKEDASPYSEGDDLSFSKESDNGTKVCFSVTDTANNTVYMVSGIIEGIDRTAPIINITNPSDGIVSEKIVKAADTDTAETVWEYKILDNAAEVCNAGTMANGAAQYSEESEVTFTDESANGSRVCFSSTDVAGNTAYAVSAPIAGTISITINARSDNGLIQSDGTPIEYAQNKIISATDLDDITETVWSYKQIAGDASCNERQMSRETQPYIEGDEISFSKESDNGTKVCFSVTDTANNTVYMVSGVIEGIDRTAPSITVAGASTAVAQSKIVKATDTDTAETVWEHKVLNSAVELCNAAAMANGGVSYSEEGDVTFTDEDANGSRVCFSSADAAGNIAYAVSMPIAGIDATAPIITIANPDMSVASNYKEVQADDTEEVSAWQYQQIDSTAVCDETALTDPVVYAEGTTLTFGKDADNGTKVCFAVSDVAGNTAYDSSAAFANINETASTINITTSTWVDPAQADDSTIVRVQAKAVVGTDGNDTPTEWFYKQIAGDAACDASVKAQDVLPYTEGIPVVLKKETDNGTKVCFISVDRNGIVSAAASEVIVGIDTTAPTIAITAVTSDPAQNKVISARDYDTNETVWMYKQVAGNTRCNADQMSSNAQPYTEGMELTFAQESDNGTKVCFSVTDSADNTMYRMSGMLAGIDATKPTISSATLVDAKRTQTKVVVGDRVQSFGTFSAGNFRVEIDGVSYEVVKVSGLKQSVDAQETYFTITHPAIVQESIATLTYTGDSEGGIVDAVGNALESFTGLAMYSTKFVTLSLSDSSINDGSSDQVALTVSASLDTFSNGDVVEIHKKGSAARVLKSVLVSSGIVGAADADGDASFEIVLPKRVFTVDEDTILFAVYTPVGGTVGQKGVELAVPYHSFDIVAPIITVDPLTNGPAQSKTVRATDDDENKTIWSFRTMSAGDVCNANTMTSGLTAYEEGRTLVFDDEQMNDTKVCFSSTDEAGNVSYAPSMVITGIDSILPKITVSGPAGGFARSKTVQAANQDQSVASWVYKQMNKNALCGERTMLTGVTAYTEGEEITFDREDDNDTKVCFAATDGAGNASYATSGVIDGIDNTKPTISVVHPTAGVSPSKVIRATDTDEEGVTEWKYKVIKGNANCTEDAMRTKTHDYREGSGLVFRNERANGWKICFSSTDRIGNVSYSASRVMQGIDINMPSITSAKVSAKNVVTVVVSEGVYAKSAPAKSDFTLTKNNGAVLAITSIHGLPTTARRADTSFMLNFSGTLVAGDTLTLTYHAGSNEIKDKANNVLESIPEGIEVAIPQQFIASQGASSFMMLPSQGALQRAAQN